MSVNAMSRAPVSFIKKTAQALHCGSHRDVQSALTLAAGLTCDARRKVAQFEERWSVGGGEGPVARFSSDRLYYLMER